MTARALLAGALASAFLFTGCAVPGLNDVPLPGGVDVGDDPVRVTVESTDTLNLAKKATVKVDDVTVGVVDDITRVGWNARLTLLIRSDIELPANAIATVRQTGLLGEKFVDLSAPVAEPARGRLRTGAEIGMDRAFRGAEVEDVLGALSLLLNGGGLERVRTISHELHAALDGREGEFRGLLEELRLFTTSLDRNRTAILEAIDGMDRLTARVNDGRDTIDKALTTIGPALHVLAGQRKQLVRMLSATAELGQVGTRTIVGLRREMVASLNALRPILTELAESGDDLPKALEFALTFPFPDEILDATYGDYVNIDLDLNVTLQTLATAISGGKLPVIPGLDGLPELPELPELEIPKLPELPPVTGLPELTDLQGLLRKSSRMDRRWR